MATKRLVGLNGTKPNREAGEFSPAFLLGEMKMNTRQIKIKNEVRMVIRQLNKKLLDMTLKGPITVSFVESKQHRKSSRQPTL